MTVTASQDKLNHVLHNVMNLQQGYDLGKTLSQNVYTNLHVIFVQDQDIFMDLKYKEKDAEGKEVTRKILKGVASLLIPLRHVW